MLESGWAPGVLVDNKSVAEIWCEVSCPRRVLGWGVARRHWPGGTAGASLRRRPITLTGGKLYVNGKGAPATSRGFNFSTRSDSQPERVGIKPIEDILGREVVSSNRRAVNRSWCVRNSERLLTEASARHREVEASAPHRASDRGCQNLRWKGRLPQPKGAGSW